jgi:hypothetical protein
MIYLPLINSGYKLSAYSNYRAFRITSEKLPHRQQWVSGPLRRHFFLPTRCFLVAFCFSPIGELDLFDVGSKKCYRESENQLASGEFAARPSQEAASRPCLFDPRALDGSPVTTSIKEPTSFNGPSITNVIMHLEAKLTLNMNIVIPEGGATSSGLHSHPKLIREFFFRPYKYAKDAKFNFLHHSPPIILSNA